MQKLSASHFSSGAGPHEPNIAGKLTLALAHFLWFGFRGQIAFTLLILLIPNDRDTSFYHLPLSGSQLMLVALCLPGVCAVRGAVLTFRSPLDGLVNSRRIVLTCLGVGVLALCDLFLLLVWDMAGSC